MSPTPTPPAPDAEADEAEPEHEREEEEHPLRVPAKPREEHGVLDRRRGRRGDAWALPQHRLRALRAASLSSSHVFPPFSYRGSPDTRVATTPVRRSSENGRRNRIFPRDERRVRRARGRSGRPTFRGRASRPRASSPSARAPPSVASSSASARRERVGPPLARARADDRRAHLVEHVERRRRGGAVGRDARRGSRPRAAPRAARPRSRGSPFERGQCATRDVVLGEERDLLLVDLDAVRGDDARAEQARLGERADARRAGRRHEHLRERRPVARPVAQELRLGVALGEVRRDRQAELARTPRRARSCTCTARAARCRGATSLGERAADRARAVGSNRSRSGSSVAPKTSR